MSASYSLTPVIELDEPFLIEFYASTRAEEMSVVRWSGEQKQAFLQSQFEAQNPPLSDFEFLYRAAGRFSTEIVNRLRVKSNLLNRSNFLYAEFHRKNRR